MVQLDIFQQRLQAAHVTAAQAGLLNGQGLGEILHKQRGHRKEPGLPLQIGDRLRILREPEDLLHMTAQLVKGHGSGLILRVEGQGKAQLVKGGHIMEHDHGIDVHHQVTGIAGALGLVELVGIDNIKVTGFKLTLCVLKIAGYPAFDKEQQLHRLVPVGRRIGAEGVLILDAKAGSVHFRQHPVLRIQHNFSSFSGVCVHISNILGSYPVHRSQYLPNRSQLYTFCPICQGAIMLPC